MGGRPARHPAQVPADYGESAATDAGRAARAQTRQLLNNPPQSPNPSPSQRRGILRLACVVASARRGRVAWRLERPMSQDTTPSRLVRPMFLNHEQCQQRAELRRVYNNQKCSCAENGASGPGAPDFIEHSMFCQLYKCYAN
ncbi:MAG: hypothetical protein SGPRY_013603 [Prymnesium sp.]